MIRTLLAIATALTFSGAQAGTMLDTSTAFTGTTQAYAARPIEALAQSGDAGAQLRMGLSHYNGQGADQDYTLALEWAGKSAAQGNVEAMYLTGNILMYGPRAQADSEAAARDAAYWYTAAARQGHVEAQYALGLLYFTGKGVEEDREAAQRWFERAAGNGYPQAGMFVARKPTPCNY